MLKNKRNCSPGVLAMLVFLPAIVLVAIWMFFDPGSYATSSSTKMTPVRENQIVVRSWKASEDARLSAVELLVPVRQPNGKLLIVRVELDQVDVVDELIDGLQFHRAEVWGQR